MPDDGEVDSRDELVERLLNIVELQARALNREAAQNALDARNGAWMRHLQEHPVAFRQVVDQAIGTYQPPAPKRRHRPHQKELRLWSTFRAHFQKLESDVRRELQLKPEDEFTKQMAATWGALSVKTIDRCMVETHGLALEQWPPSTWPEEAPGLFDGQF